jgi:hypothetical protein
VTLLQGITNGLLQTIANRETNTAVATKQYEDHIHTLEQWVLHYKDTFNKPPMGYIPNNGKISDFHIPVSGRLYQEAKWICLNDDGTVSGYHSTQGPNEQPYIIDLYRAPDYSVNSPIEPLPPWFHHMLTGPEGNFQILQQTVAETNDWGLMQEIACYCEIDDNIASLMTCLEEYQRDIDTAQASLASRESHLMLARAGEQVETLHNILQKPGATRSGWRRITCMVCNVYVQGCPL